MDKDNFIEAKTLFSYAHSLDEKSIYVIQKLALSTYKSKTPNHVSSLYEALKILEVLNLNNSTDPETLGLVGSIHKLLWEELNELKHLNISIQFYEKGFNIKKDYYNGINLAYLLNVRGSVSSRNNAIADYILANRIRKQVVKICEQLLVSSFDNRSDQYWIVATLEEALYGLGDQEKYLETKKQAESLTKFNWERETTEKQIEKMSTLLRNSPLL
ncbi:TRAFs-binding domain-containing protein [Bacillus pumilus]